MFFGNKRVFCLCFNFVLGIVFEVCWIVGWCCEDGIIDLFVFNSEVVY